MLQAPTILSRTVTLTWQAPANNFLNSLTAVFSYRVSCTANQVLFSVNDLLVDTGRGATTYTFSDVLEEYTLYTCTVTAQNSFGLGGRSVPVEFTTLQAGLLLMCKAKVTQSTLCTSPNLLGPSSPPQHFSGYAESPTVIVLTWSPPPPADINGVLLYYEIQVEEMETGQDFTLSTLSLEEQLRVESLHPYYNYLCQIAAYTTEQGTFSDEIRVQTLEVGEHK